MAQQMTAQQMDSMIQQHLLDVASDMIQPISSGVLVPNGFNNTITQPMRGVGLTKGFIVKLTATFSNPDTAIPAALTPLGAANLVTNFTITDPSNYQRVNTSGVHLHFLNSAKEGYPFGAALLASATDSPVAYGSNFPVISAPATIPVKSGGVNGTGTVNMYYWVPCAYGKTDLRGAIYTGIVNANAYLAMTINAASVSPSGDSVTAVYQQTGSATPAFISSLSYTVYQNYLDQLPKYIGGPNVNQPVLPPVALATQYMLNNTTFTGLAPNSDFFVPFANFRSFLSAMIIMDNGGTLYDGSDINRFKMQAANTLQYFDLDPVTQALRQRTRLQTDFPRGVYMFDFRDQPITTNQQGNMQIAINPSLVNTGAQLLVGWEAFALTNTVLGAGSLPGAGS